MSRNEATPAEQRQPAQTYKGNTTHVRTRPAATKTTRTPYECKKTATRESLGLFLSRSLPKSSLVSVAFAAQPLSEGDVRESF